jgi:hypothetical protein
LILTILSKQSIEVDAKVQAQRVMLMAMYGTTSIGGRECMGLVNPKDSSLAMHVSHLGFDIWAKAIVSFSSFLFLHKDNQLIFY